MRIIGLTGYAQHGKDTLADEFQKLLYERAAFAAALKTMLYELDPIIGLTDAGWSTLQPAVDAHGWDVVKQTPEVRRLLQRFGTEVMRNHLGDEVWVELLGKRLDRDQRSVVITDVRFPNEAEAVHRWGGIVVRVTRLNADDTVYDNGLGTDHPSEAHISSLPVDLDVQIHSGDLGAFRRWAATIDRDYSRLQLPIRGPRFPSHDEFKELFT
jgi:hypothetical protein